MRFRLSISWWWESIDRTINQHVWSNGKLHRYVRTAFSWKEVAEIEQKLDADPRGRS